MLRAEGKNWIVNFRRKWIALYFAQAFALSLAIALILIVLLASTFIFTFAMWQLIVVFLLVFGCFMVMKPSWKISETVVVRYLDAKFLQLEESTALFLKQETALTTLERLQLEKIAQKLPIQNSLSTAWRKLLLSLCFLVITIIGVYLMDRFYWYEAIEENPTAATAQKQNIKENILPQIADFELVINPPAYTKRAESNQKQFSIRAETGSKVSWTVETNVAVQKLRLIFNDKESFNLIKTDKLKWTFNKMINQSGFYQIELDGKKSDLYQIEVIPDLPVQIKIIKPKNHTTIDVGQIPKVNLSVNLVDDYGIANAYISATMSSGKGEGVSFTEKKLTFNANFTGNKSMLLNKLLDLTALGMKPGDELYFFIQAIDNHGQSSRSEVYLVSIVDTSELMSMAGMTNGVDLVPEYFRSQRQIIIDTEKLLKDQVTLSANEFKDRSNNLGIDQKLLRLRYGKFLGEESETEIGGHEHSEGDGHDHEEAKFGDVQALMDEYAHKHDIAEDATFFEPELKAQLKAVLNEMWSSELRLRTYKPQEALPFEYKALRLLKDLQQKSRAYVAKTTIKTVKLKAEKRLSGELDKITTPTQKATFEDKDKSKQDLKMVLALLEQRKTGKPFDYGGREFLRSTEAQLINAASGQPVSYLPALKSLRKISLAKQVDVNDIELVQKAIQRLLGIESALPQAKSAAPTKQLSRSYFNYLKNGGR